MAELCIELFHGRNDLDEYFGDWGFDGPIIGPAEYVASTYLSDIRIGLIDTDNKCCDCELKFVDGCVLFDSKYYGDFSVFALTEEIRRGPRFVRFDSRKHTTDGYVSGPKVGTLCNQQPQEN